MVIPLIDVVSLSRKICSQPIYAHLVYATSDNFVGRIIAGYTAGLTQVALMAPQAAQALCQVQTILLAQGYGLMVYDAYRPKRACQDFLIWSRLPVSSKQELARKAIHYPAIEKQALFSLNYVAEHSDHCYGDTVDVFLYDLTSGIIADMGACFDFMDASSHPANENSAISTTALVHRERLAQAMQQGNFKPYPTEFWHFTYALREITEALDIEINAQTVESLNS